jgi:hypothetical protein
MPKPEIPKDRRRRTETNKLSDVNELIRKGEWELYKVEADNLAGFTYILIERQSPPKKE